MRWVLAQTMRTGVTMTRQAAVPSWLDMAARYSSMSSEPLVPARVIDCGSFMVTKVSRPPRRLPAVSKWAPASSTSRLSSSQCSSFCTTV